MKLILASLLNVTFIPIIAPACVPVVVNHGCGINTIVEALKSEADLVLYSSSRAHLFEIKKKI